MKKIILFIIMLTLLVACGNSGEDREVKKKIKELIGVEPYLPETDYEIASLIADYNIDVKDDGKLEKGDPRLVRISYKEGVGDPLEESYIKKWNDQQEFSEIIIGYEADEPVLISLEIAKDGMGELMDSEIIEIEGHEVQYQYLGSAVMMFINFDDIGYAVTYSVKSEKMEDEAKELAKEIIENNK